MDKYPNFLIIGSPKAGPTSLFNYLSRHPDISFATQKEPKYFSFKYFSLDFKGNSTVLNQIRRSTIQNYDDYQKIFRETDTKFIGESTPDYLHFNPAAKHIYEFNAFLSFKYDIKKINGFKYCTCIDL